MKPKYILGAVALITLITLLCLPKKDKKKIEEKIDDKIKMSDDTQLQWFLVYFAD